MKKQEMIEFIEDELLDFEKLLEIKSGRDKRFHRRRAEAMLDMLLGFDMLPPGGQWEDEE